MGTVLLIRRIPSNKCGRIEWNIKSSLEKHHSNIVTDKIHQFSSVQSRPTLCDLMDCSMPGFLVHHQLPEPIQTHVHLVGEAIQPYHPLSSPSPPVISLSQYQGLFKWVSCSHQVATASASVLTMNIQDWFPIGLTGLISLQSKQLWRVFSNTTVPKHQFFGAQLSLWSNSHTHTWLLEKPQL